MLLNSYRFIKFIKNSIILFFRKSTSKIALKCSYKLLVGPYFLFFDLLMFVMRINLNNNFCLVKSYYNEVQSKRNDKKVSLESITSKIKF